MATFKAKAVTAEPAKAIHAGLNTKISDYLIAATPAAADIIQMCNLPAGAQVVGVSLTHRTGVVAGGTIISDTEGNVYDLTGTATISVQHVGDGVDFGNRLTGDAVMQITYNGITGTIAGADSSDIRLTVQYLSELCGD